MKFHGPSPIVQGTLLDLLRALLPERTQLPEVLGLTCDLIYTFTSRGVGFTGVPVGVGPKSSVSVSKPRNFLWF